MAQTAEKPSAEPMANTWRLWRMVRSRVLNYWGEEKLTWDFSKVLPFCTFN